MNSSNSTQAPVDRANVQTAITNNVITVILCIGINYINSTLIYTFHKYQVFYKNPRYILYIHLVINDIILLTMFTLIQVLSYIVFTINVSLCIVMVLIAIPVTINNPLTLAVMALECYIAVCFPLHYSRICTVRRVYIALGIMWLLSSLSIFPDLFVALASESIEFFHSRVFCLPDRVFRQPYFDSKRKILNQVFLVLIWLTLFYTYFKIISAAKAAAHDARKARNTVLLHGFQLLLCMLSYVYNVTIDALLLLFPNSIRDIRFAITILIHLLPRLVSPVVYGLRDKVFRKYLKMNLCCTRNVKINQQNRS